MCVCVCVFHLDVLPARRHTEAVGGKALFEVVGGEKERIERERKRERAASERAESRERQRERGKEKDREREREREQREQRAEQRERVERKRERAERKREQRESREKERESRERERARERTFLATLSTPSGARPTLRWLHTDPNCQVVRKKKKEKIEKTADNIETQILQIAFPRSGREGEREGEG